MTIIIHIGRRVPRSWFKRTASRVEGLISFQENIWQIIKQSMNLAKRKANSSNTGIKFVLTNPPYEVEDLNWQIEWMKIIIQGNQIQEKEEYEEAMNIYKPFGKLMKKEFDRDENFAKPFKSTMLSTKKIDECYKTGYGVINDSNISNKLLEMGILTHIELIPDYENRLQI